MKNSTLSPSFRGNLLATDIGPLARLSHGKRQNGERESKPTTPNCLHMSINELMKVQPHNLNISQEAHLSSLSLEIKFTAYQF